LHFPTVSTSIQISLGVFFSVVYHISKWTRWMTMMGGSVAIFGLGAMGSGMAGALLRAGLTTHGYDINKDAVACATMAPDIARGLAKRCDELGLLYLDAPVSGGTIKAGEGTLSILAAGSSDAFEQARPALNAMAAEVFELGNDVGAGSSMKAVNQMLVGIQIAAMAEAMTFGMTQGVTPEKFLEVIRQCAGTSWALESRAPHVIAGDYTPLSAVDIWPKDLGIVLDIAKGAKFGAPLTAAALQQYLAASGSGLGLEDDAAVAKVYARNANLTLPEKA
jgi:3-hydroxyisobutyrate dehydrogenase